MKVYGKHCLVDTDQVALYIARDQENIYEVLYKTYGNSGYGTLFSGSRKRCQEIMDFIVEAERDAEKVIVLPNQ